MRQQQPDPRLPRAVFLLAGACACTPGPNVVGGTPEQRQAIEALRDTFLAATSSEVRVSRIRLGKVLGGQGRYSRVDRSIALDEDLPLEVLLSNFGHELCHAMDLQLGLDTDEAPFWTYALSSQSAGYSEAKARREAFADICKHGPAAWSEVGDCTPDGATLTTTRAKLFDLAEPSAPMSLTQGITVPLDPGLTLIDATATENALIMLRFYNPNKISQFFWFNPETGEQDTPEGGLIAPTAADAQALTPWRQRDGLQTTQGALASVQDWTDVAGHTYTTAFLDQDGVRTAHCIPDAARFVEVNGRLWLITSDGPELHFSEALP